MNPFGYILFLVTPHLIFSYSICPFFAQEHIVYYTSHVNNNDSLQKLIRIEKV